MDIIYDGDFLENGYDKINTDLLVLNNLKSKTITKCLLPSIKLFDIYYDGKEKYGLTNFYNFRLWPPRLFTIKIEFDFSNFNLIEDKLCPEIKELNFMRKQENKKTEIEILPYYELRRREIDEKINNNNIKIIHQFKYNAPFGPSEIIFKLGNYEKKFNVHQPK